MSESVRWYENLHSYKEIVAIEFVRDEDVLPIMEHLGQNLRPCPYDLIEPMVMVVPKEAIKLLPLEGVPHKQVELRDLFAVSSAVCREILRRFAADQEPHYYITESIAWPPSEEVQELLQKTGREVPTEPRQMRVVYRMYTQLSTVQEIEEQLAAQPA